MPFLSGRKGYFKRKYKRSEFPPTTKAEVNLFPHYKVFDKTLRKRKHVCFITQNFGYKTVPSAALGYMTAPSAAHIPAEVLRSSRHEKRSGEKSSDP